MKFIATSSGAVSRRLQERIQNWAGERKIAAGLHVPEELFWWKVQEYGTPARTITPKESALLAFPGEGGGTALRESVNWPGIDPKGTVAKTIPEVHDAAREKVRAALQDGAMDKPSLLQQALLGAVETGKALIVDGMTVDLPGTRPINEKYPKQSGKLSGQTASAVFEELSEVVNTSE